MLNRKQKENLSPLIGVDIKEVDKYLIKSGVYDKSIKNCYVVENAIAVLLNEDLPSTVKGRDFKDYEVKTLSVKRLKNGEFRTKGDTQISKYEYSSDLLETNLWDKLEKIILVLHIDDKIVDIKYLCNTGKLKQLQKEYSNCSKEDHRSLNKMLVRKGFNKNNPDSKDDMIMIKGSEAILQSESIVMEGYGSKSLDDIFKVSVAKWVASEHKSPQNKLKGYSTAQLEEELERRSLVLN